ncbi:MULTISPECIES: hypothetical protein [Bacillus cereus group]|uniref:Lipoprotein n=1 Tax=Bacillus thuringiensis Bt18247 TaxID=1423143 RepID=A0A9W3SUL7_BACTU|nr:MULTISPECIES: hypothetical protein [Bacillus cereus group]AOM11489.1 hypothetical protein BTI247_31010 [Bacillus thuringiensis Bt18247]MBG9523830.1 hypothetical protein [Bacillus thuringiensis]MBJ8125851.1 hypothetical protein [Bacillus cereus]MYW26312.1 hypothetical protein [Bacillus thuringiensis]
MKRKLLATIAAVCLSLTACNSTEETKNVKAKEKTEKSVEQKTDTANQKVKEVKSASTVEQLSQDHNVSIEGDGKNSSDFFELKSGFVIADVEHTGKSNAILHLKDEQGNDAGTLSNFIGNGKQKKLVVIKESGKYFIDALADGHWSANMSQSIPMDKVVTTPGVVSGHGSDVIFVKLEKGLKEFHGVHNNGKSNFIVHLNDNTLFNEIGNADTTKKMPVKENGIHIFTIQADGDWTIEVK